MMDRVQRRLALALAASALLHAWFVHGIEGDGALHAYVKGAAPLIATLAAAPAVDAVDAMAPIALPSAPQPQRATPPPDMPSAAQPQPPAAESDGTRTAPAALPGDPTYYAARSLDVYPQALTALDLGVTTGAGQVRATVLIDESGAVNDVRAIQAGAVEIANAARELLWRTRFTPAAKDGRIVKAQVVVSLDYGAPQAP